MEFSSAVEKNQIRKAEGKWMKVEGCIVSEVTQPQRHKCFTNSLLLCLYNLKYMGKPGI